MSLSVAALFVIEMALSLVLLAHSLVQLWLALAVLHRRRSREHAVARADPPLVTVQLPMYNERHVAERAIEHAARLEHPHDRLEIQVLDDSTDDTSTLVDAAILRLRLSHLSIAHLKRPHRRGFKAGALRDGLARSRGELVAIFDADFTPSADFLSAVLPYFDDPRVAAVQTRWSHLNADHSFLTRAQAVLLDTHFSVEQEGRSAIGAFVTFSGSAGVWRREAIIDAGNWSDATLTEDLDLSYRAQLRGWRIVYLDRVRCAGELPQTLHALRSQQARWMTGVAQNCVRSLPSVLRAHIPARVKLHASTLLLESALYLVPLGVPITAAAIPLLTPTAALVSLSTWPPPFLLAAAILVAVSYVPRRGAGAHPMALLRHLAAWAGFFVLTTGLSAHNTAAVMRGWLRPGGEFERTPKTGGVVGSTYAPTGTARVPLFEAAVWLLLLALLVDGVRLGVTVSQWLALVAFAALTLVLGIAYTEAARSPRSTGISAARHPATIRE